MEINLFSKCIKELIVENDRVDVPYLGTFTAEMMPASYSDRQTTIQPPYRRMSFRKADVTLADGSFESYIRDSLMEYLKTLLLAAYAAGRLGVSLSEAEQREVDLAADALYADLAEAASKFGITKDAVRDAYRHYALAQIFYRQTITDAKLEIMIEEFQKTASQDFLGMNRWLNANIRKTSKPE